MNCRNCKTALMKSDKRQFDIQKKWVPKDAQRMSISKLSLWICRKCGIMEVHHQHQGYQGTYGILWHEWWHGKFRNDIITTTLEADLFYAEGGYAQFLPRGAFIRDFQFQKTRWHKHSGPKPKQFHKDQNVLFS